MTLMPHEIQVDKNDPSYKALVKDLVDRGASECWPDCRDLQCRYGLEFHQTAAAMQEAWYRLGGDRYGV